MMQPSLLDSTTTGQPSRRGANTRSHGDEAYVFEELVAEIGASMLMAELSITPDPRPDHAHYLAHWLSILKADKRAIFTAAARAQEAIEFLHGFQSDARPEAEDPISLAA